MRAAGGAVAVGALHPSHHLASGTYTLRITRAGRTLVRRTVHIGR